MNMRLYFGIGILLCSTTVNVRAGLISSGANLVDQIKPNLTTRSKPTTSHYPKYASVSFLQADTKLDFKGGEQDARTMCLSSGYGMLVSSCTARGKNSSLLCPHDSTYTDSCCDKEYNHTADSSCSNNAVLSSSFCKRTVGENAVKYYKCECPASAYPYQKESDCPNGYRIDFNPAKTCEANGEKRYAACIPKSYKDCSKEGIVNGAKGGLVGSGNSGFGMLADGTVVYEKCVCPSQFVYADCDTFLIDESASCYNDGHYYYKAGNCYAGCTDNGSTDIDYYYKQSAMRCLFDDTGIISSTSPDKQYDHTININLGDKDKALCTRVIDGSEQVSKQTCAELGYVYSEDECPDKDNLILRCPSNDKKVWCMNANGCMNYPVSGEACNTGAKVSYCGSDQRRCIYDDSECNRNWNAGQHNGGYGGSTAKCCKDGWDYINGKCVEHDCGNVAYLYPYGDKYPIEEAAANGESSITMCRSGDKVYYGYAQCKGCGYGDTYTSNSCDDLWQPAADTPHRCVCKTDGLPYDNVTLYTTGGAGKYGVIKTCRDTEATYYGYSTCNRYYAAQYTNGKRNGLCNYDNGGCWYSAYSEFESSEVFKNLGSLPLGCSATEEAACLVDDEKCHVCNNEKYDFIQNCYYGSTRTFRFHCNKDGKCCPDDKAYYSGDDTGVCFNKCSWGSADCQRDDIIYVGNVPVGVVWYVSGKTVYIAAIEADRKARTWDDAKKYCEQEYAPSGLESDSRVGKGKWYMPQRECGISEMWISHGRPRWGRVYAVVNFLNNEVGSKKYNWTDQMWVNCERASSDTSGYDLGIIAFKDGANTTSKQNLNYGYPMITYTKP